MLVCSAVRSVEVERTQGLDLVEVAGVAGRGERGRARRGELGGAVHQQRRHEGEPRRRHRQERRRRGPPDTWCRRPGEEDGGVAAVVGAQPDQAVGGADAERDAAGLRRAVGKLRQRRGVVGVQGGLRGRDVGHQDLVGGGHRGRLGRGAAGRVGMEPVGRITSLDADHRVIDSRLDKRRIEDVLDRLLGRVGRQGSDRDRVPVGDDARIAGRRRRRRRRRGGSTCGEGDQERHGRAECEPRAGVRGPALGKREMAACVHLGPPRLGARHRSRRR